MSDDMQTCSHESVDTFASGAGRRVDVCMACDRAVRYWTVDGDVTGPSADADERTTIRAWISGIEDERWRPSPATKRHLARVLRTHLALLDAADRAAEARLARFFLASAGVDARPTGEDQT